MNRSSVVPAYRKKRQKGDPALRKKICRFHIPVGVGPSHTKDIKNGKWSLLAWYL